LLPSVQIDPEDDETRVSPSQSQRDARQFTRRIPTVATHLHELSDAWFSHADCARLNGRPQEARLRRVFDKYDTSGGGGFITPEALDACLRDLGMTMPATKRDEVAGTGIVVWQDLYRALALPPIGVYASEPFPITRAVLCSSGVYPL
jgi:hypothetical protein